ncbi:MAG: DUF445 family protein, partial [Caulobacteraceae bacterium]
PKGALRDLAGAGALSAVRAVPAAPLAAKILRAIWADRAGQAALESALTRIADLLDERQADIREGLAERSHTWLPRWVDRMLAGQVAQGAARLARDMLDPAHPWRAELERWVERQIARLADDPELRARGETLKLRLLADPRLKAAGEELWAEVEHALASVAHAERRQLAERLRPALQALGAWLAEDAAAQARLNTWSRLIVRRLIAPRRADIGGFVAQVVASWDARAVAERLELQVGRDLQFIRINGALVGGLVGLLIFAVARATGLG